MTLEPFNHALLDEERLLEPTLDAKARARVLQRLEPMFAVGLVAPVVVSGLSKKAAMGVALAMGMTGAAIGSGVTALVMQRPVIVRQVVVQPPPVVAVQPEPVVSAPLPVAPRKPLVAPTPTASSLESEQVLLETARAAILNRRFDDALATLNRHRIGFASGQLAEEREALAIQALGLSGREDEARARAADFRTRYPQSMLMPAVDAISAP